MMTERLSKDDVAHVAKLARLSVTDDELTMFTSQLSAILDHVAELQTLDLDGVEPMAHPLPLTNVFRTDEIRPSANREEVLAQAPAAEDGQFRVPPVLGEEQ